MKTSTSLSLLSYSAKWNSLRVTMHCLVLAIFAVAAMAHTAATKGGPGFHVTKPLAKRTSSGHSVSSNVLKLKKMAKVAKSSSYLKTLRATSAPNSKRHDYGAVPVHNLLSAEYITQISWNGIPMNVIIDTGSSDSWLVQDGFTCVDQENRAQPVRALSSNTSNDLLTVGSSSKLAACSVLPFRAYLTTEPSQTNISI